MSKFYPIKLPGTRVIYDDVKAAIIKEEYTKLGTKMTACTLTLSNGYEVVGISGVIDAKTYDIKIGSKIAKEKAEEEVWSILGSLLQNQM